MKKTSKNAVLGLDLTPRDFWRNGKVAGEVGIEIEVEGKNLPGFAPEEWNVVPDGSLRNGGVEYVLRQPIKRSAVADALKNLYKTLTAPGVQVNQNYRTSVHIHINQDNMKFRRILTEMCVYMMFEELLAELCGQERIGNLFCLRTRDAEHIIDAIRDAVQTGNYTFLRNKEQYKYGAINISALATYGSLEYRAFRGTIDPDEINQWVEILLDIKDSVDKFENPQELVKDYSVLGVHKLIEKIFRPQNAKILLGMKAIEPRVLEGMRLAQEIAYAIPSWSAPPVNEKKQEVLDGYGGDIPEDNPLRQFIVNVGEAPIQQPKVARVQLNAWNAVAPQDAVADVRVHDDDDDMDDDF